MSNQALTPELKAAAKEIRHGVTLTAKWINRLNIPDRYKALYLRTSRYRGWRNIREFEPELIDIASYGCDATQMFLSDKLCGIRKLHEIVMNYNEKQRAELYQSIKNQGVKLTNREIEKEMAKLSKNPSLFSQTDYSTDEV